MASQPTISSMKYCIGCANELHTSATTCPKCGATQGIIPGVSRKSKTVAGIFALLLGGIGIHKFYLGQVGLGILYLIFCWTFIPAIIAFIEAIILLTTSDEAFAAKYG